MRGKPSAYSKLTVAAKQRYIASRSGEPPMQCPRCEAGVPPRDLLRHMAERCQGPGPVHALSRWLTKRDVLELVNADVVERWQRAGLLRLRVADGDDGELEYAERDVVRLVAIERVMTEEDHEEGPTPPPMWVLPPMRGPRMSVAASIGQIVYFGQ